MRYELHNNDPVDARYVQHLCRLKDPLCSKLSAGQRGLDFGSGPTAVLSQLFTASGFPTQTYDPYFCPEIAPHKAQYDFISCCEAAEHFRVPRQEFALMHSLLKPAAWIGIMTNLRTSSRRSASWWYLRDPTHRCIYSARSFEFLETLLPWRLESLRGDVVLLQVKE
jgi:hypothetical protein